MAQLSSVVPGRGLRIEVDGKEIALFFVKGKVYAIDNTCPHEGGSLSEGDVQDEKVICPLHGWTFNVCTGCSLDPLDQQVARYETRDEGERVLITL